jgi:hypothetical protein
MKSTSNEIGWFEKIILNYLLGCIDDIFDDMKKEEIKDLLYERTILELERDIRELKGERDA